MRTMGCILIFLGFLSAGAVCAAAGKRRIDTLRELSLALSLMEAELASRLTPMPELAALLAERTRGQAGAFFQTLSASMGLLGSEPFDALWRRAAGESLQALKKEELDEWVRLGNVLGRYELDKQLAALKGCGGAMQAALSGAQREYPNEKRLRLGLAAAAGAMLVIALL